MDQSRFWRRLDDLSRKEKSEDRKRSIDHLKASIRKVTEEARWVSTQVCRFMPQYTLHEERHFLNVLAIMDALVPDEVMARFGAVDCALPILAAYMHDLGMALSQDEYDCLHAAGRREAGLPQLGPRTGRPRVFGFRFLNLDYGFVKMGHRRGDRAAMAPRHRQRRGHDRGIDQKLLHADQDELRRKAK
jgi:hypothetical protein